MIELRGITWAHPRGFTPLVAASEAWCDRHPDLMITWTKRSLWGFGEGPLDEVAREFDLIVFDHPLAGIAAERKLLRPLGAFANPEELNALEADSVGASFSSYCLEGQAYGLPVDAACQMAACREDLLADAGYAIPSNWQEALALARETGRVRCAFSPMGTLGMFHTLSASQGSLPGREGAADYVPVEIAATSLHSLRALFEAVGPDSLQQSPVNVLREMSGADTVLYAPMLYGYSNYCRRGFAPQPLRFAPPPVGNDGAGATLGGAGIGVSAFCGHPERAVAFACWVAGAECQASLYLLADGQPALRSVWRSELANRITGDFFLHCLPVAERAFVRLNAAWFPAFQSEAAALIRRFLADGGNERDTARRLNGLYRHALGGAQS